LHIVSNQSIKCPDAIGNLMWVKTCVCWDATQNS